MNEQLYIPTKLKVGFQNRNGTYTGKLAYIIYFDQSGTLKKETSWKSWRDQKIEPQDFTNEPTEGFVINKNVGGVKASYSWNARQEYVRVFDPRGFEFEINIPNLLFILQETNSIKGKGLEGKFVYAWSGPTLILLPVHCNEYKSCLEFTDIQSQKISTKDLVPGCSYITKKQAHYVYLGKFDIYERSYDKTKCKKKFIFLNTKTSDFDYFASIDKFAYKASDDLYPDFASHLDRFINSPDAQKIKRITFATAEEKDITLCEPIDDNNFKLYQKNRYTKQDNSFYFIGKINFDTVKNHCSFTSAKNYGIKEHIQKTHESKTPILEFENGLKKPLDIFYNLWYYGYYSYY